MNLDDVLKISIPAPLVTEGESGNDHEAFTLVAGDNGPRSRTVCWTTNSLGASDKEFVSEEDRANAALLMHGYNMLHAGIVTELSNMCVIVEAISKSTYSETSVVRKALEKACMLLKRAQRIELPTEDV